MSRKNSLFTRGISNADLLKEALEFCAEDLDGFDGIDYDSDSEVCCQRSNVFIRELARRLEHADATPSVRYLNLVDRKIYVIISEDQEFVSYALERGGATHHLGRSEFEKRFQSVPAPTPQTIEGGIKDLPPDQYMKVHDAAILAYETNTPSYYRYSAVGLRRAVDAAFEAYAALSTTTEGE